MKHGRVILSDGGFILPDSLIGFKVLPLQFQLDYGVLLGMHLSLVQYMKRFRGNLLLQLQLFFPKFLKFWAPPHDFALF